MRRHPENSSDFVDLELARFKKLRLFRRYGDGRVFQPFLQHSYFIAVGAAAEGGLPALPDTLRVFDRTRMLQHTARCCTVGEELRTVFLRSHCQTDCVLRHRNRRVTDQPVVAKPQHMKHIAWSEDNIGLFILAYLRRIVAVFRIAVIEPSLTVAVNLHAVGHQRVECHDLAASVADNLRVGVTRQQQVVHHRFPKDKRGHFRIRLVVQDPPQRVVEILFLAAVLAVFVQKQRQTRDCLRKNANTGINRCHLHGSMFVDHLTSRRIAPKKAAAAKIFSRVSL